MIGIALLLIGVVLSTEGVHTTKFISIFAVMVVLAITGCAAALLESQYMIKIVRTINLLSTA